MTDTISNEYKCSVCERRCNSDKHGRTFIDGEPVCDDCRYGHDDEETDND